MLQLRRETDYALLLLKILSRHHGHFISLKVAADEAGISFLFLQKIARKLRLANLIEAEQGVSGGYRLKKSSAQITLKQIIEAIEGKYGLLACFCAPGVKCVSKNKCRLKNKLAKINNEIIKTLTKVKLASL